MHVLLHLLVYCRGFIYVSPSLYKGSYDQPLNPPGYNSTGVSFINRVAPSFVLNTATSMRHSNLVAMVSSPSLQSSTVKRIVDQVISKKNNFSINCSLQYVLQYTQVSYNMTAFNITYANKCKKAEDREWWEDPLIPYIGGGVFSALILLFLLKVVCGYCSKYSGSYIPPHYKAARRKRGKNGWTSRQIDMMPVITDIPPP